MGGTRAVSSGQGQDREVVTGAVLDLLRKDQKPEQ
jgi:hypothetical protein